MLQGGAGKGVMAFYEGFPNLGLYVLGGPDKKDCSVLGSVLRSPYLSELSNLGIIQVNRRVAFTIVACNKYHANKPWGIRVARTQAWDPFSFRPNAMTEREIARAPLHDPWAPVSLKVREGAMSRSKTPKSYSLLFLR